MLKNHFSWTKILYYFIQGNEYVNKHITTKTVAKLMEPTCIIGFKY